MLDTYPNSPIRLVVDNSRKPKRRIVGCAAHPGIPRQQVMAAHERLMHRYHEATTTYLFSSMAYADAQALGHKAASDITPNMSNNTVACPNCWRRMLYAGGAYPGAHLLTLSKGRVQNTIDGWKVFVETQPYMRELVCPYCMGLGMNTLKDTIAQQLGLRVDGIKVVAGALCRGVPT